MNNIETKCACGCGKIIWYKPLCQADLIRRGEKRFAPGHQNKGLVHTPEQIAKSIKRLDKNGRWKGGRIFTKDGYIRIRVTNHPFANRGYVLEHRLIMEQSLGRYMHPREVIHHINHNIADNRLENLMLMTQSKHATIENTGRKIKGKWFICEHCGNPFYIFASHVNRSQHRFCSRRCRLA